MIGRLAALAAALTVLMPFIAADRASAQVAGNDPGVEVPGFWDPRRRPERPDLSRAQR